jgi:Bacterial extracellular solute-binding proteins, family 5 Middle
MWRRHSNATLGVLHAILTPRIRGWFVACNMVAGKGCVHSILHAMLIRHQDVPQTSMQSVIPDLATSWSWDEEGTELTFPLRQGVKWHDGKLFTAHVKCTWDLLTGEASEKLRINPEDRRE